MAKTVLFVCTHNAGRSVMAEAFFNAGTAGGSVPPSVSRSSGFPPRALKRDWIAKSAGTAPKSQVNPVVVQAMAEIGIDVSAHVPSVLKPADVKAAERIFTMGCTDGCPLTPPEKTEDWKLDDPAGKPIEDVRIIRDVVQARVRRLVDGLR